VADENNNRVVKLSPSGRSIAPWGSGDSGASSLNAPLALALDGDGNLWVLDAGTPPLHELSPEGKLLTQVRLQGMESTVYYAIAPDGHGHMYVIPGEAAGVAVYSISALSGTYANVPGSTFGPFGGGRGRLRQPGAIALDRQGDAFIADTGNDRIAAFSPSGAWLFAVGRKGTGAAEFDAPGGIAVDQQGNVYVADTNNNRLQPPAPSPWAARPYPHIRVSSGLAFRAPSWKSMPGDTCFRRWRARFRPCATAAYETTAKPT
jgi:DNA-binding beta-propeller fold protein YncE